MNTMKKSISTPSLHNIVQPSIRKNVSAHALHDLNFIDAIIVTKAPIYQGVQCVMSSDFPEHILSGEIDKDFLNCLVTPCDPPEDKPRTILPTHQRDEAYQEKYVEWFLRIRKSRRRETSN